MLGGAALNFGNGYTNNAAEVEALLEGLQWLTSQSINAPHVTILGDSQLIIQFVNRQATPRSAHLANKIATCHTLRRTIPVKTHVLFVPRE